MQKFLALSFPTARRAPPPRACLRQEWGLQAISTGGKTKNYVEYGVKLLYNNTIKVCGQSNIWVLSTGSLPNDYADRVSIIPLYHDWNMLLQYERTEIV